ncbi:hypothetical protein [Hymenobacter cheonanensis]|uniref:hypothetical protein n=1 Tax=Hymenobacter sp. CA2-7 TaxID=3063993 RepID=UPI002714303C|nr:hypothetical protein [Hymenobacter sp. CA2-7]MDO7887465.1 hypothetical protein [Hymenobacter sp. CA2-7]
MNTLNFCFVLGSSLALLLPNAQSIIVDSSQVYVELASYQVHFFKRHTAANHPIIVGTIYDSPSKKALPNPAMAVLNNTQVHTDSAGHYEKEVNPGVYTVTGRNIFYKNLSVNKLIISSGDSVVVDFYLQGESTTN